MRATRTFDPEPESARAARDYVATLLRSHQGLTPDLIDRAQLAVSELATNAIKHARTRFEVVVDLSDGLRIAVTDTNPDLPVLQRPSPPEGGGRGLDIVAALGDGWGIEPARIGKTIWWCVDHIT